MKQPTIEYGELFKHFDHFIYTDCHSCRAGRVYLAAGIFLGVLAMTVLTIALLTGGSLKALMLFCIGGAAGYFISAVRRNVRVVVAEGVAGEAEKQIDVLNKRVSRLSEQVREFQPDKGA